MKEKWVGYLDRCIEYSLYGMICFIPLSKATIEVFAGLAFICFIIKKILRPDFAFLASGINVFLLLFAVFSAVSLFNSGSLMGESVRALTMKWLKYMGIFMFVQDTFVKRKQVLTAVIILLAVGSLVTIDGLSQKIFTVDFIKHKPMVLSDIQLSAITGPFNHFNDFGVYLVVILSLIISLMILKKNNHLYQILLCLLGVLSITCIIFTLSRGSWLGLMSALVLMLILTPKAQRLILIFLIFLSVMIFLPGTRERFLYTFSFGGDADRFVVWNTAWRMIKENPFLGKGIGTFMSYFQKYTPQLVIQYAHNCFLQIWAETGIFSLLSFLFLIGTIFYKSVARFWKNDDFLLLGLICALFGFLIHSFFDTDLYSLQLSVLFWTLLGLTVSLSRTKLPEKPR